jgi:adenylyltransferase/sulfurtransferase
VILPAIGIDGQRRIARARVLVLGIGALGSALSSAMVRAGVGRVRIVDRDSPEIVNLHRQWLYDEHDVAERLPKAEAAARKLRAANGAVTVEPVVTEACAANMESLIDGCDLVLDGCDNFETRLVLNDACLKHGVPWIYGAAVATSGAVMSIMPGEGPCFRCLVPRLPPAGAVPTGATAGILAAVPQLVAALQSVEALKILCGRTSDLVRELRCVDLWAGTMESVEVKKGPGRCPACDEGRWEFLG